MVVMLYRVCIAQAPCRSDGLRLNYSERAAMSFLISAIASLMHLMGGSERQPYAPDLKRDRNVQAFDLADTSLSKIEHFRQKSGPD